MTELNSYFFQQEADRRGRDEKQDIIATLPASTTADLAPFPCFKRTKSKGNTQNLK